MAARDAERRTGVRALCAAAALLFLCLPGVAVVAISGADAAADDVRLFDASFAGSIPEDHAFAIAPPLEAACRFETRPETPHKPSQPRSRRTLRAPPAR